MSFLTINTWNGTLSHRPSVVGRVADNGSNAADFLIFIILYEYFWITVSPGTSDSFQKILFMSYSYFIREDVCRASQKCISSPVMTVCLALDIFNIDHSSSLCNYFNIVENYLQFFQIFKAFLADTNC